MEHFEDDDRSYLTWIAQHPAGFVLNTGNPPTPSYLILHRATCTTISVGPPRGETWTMNMRKFCADHKSELKGYARVELGGEPSACGACHPE
jgi:hypothetical protein